MALYIESPNGPLENQIIGGVPVLADNWGFGIDELGRPYFDTGFASAGQQSYLRLMGGRIAIIGQSQFLGEQFTGRPMPPNPPGRALNAGFTGEPMPPGLPGWHERPRRAADPRPLRMSPPGWYERQRVRSDMQPLPPMPPNRGSGVEFTGRPLPAMPPNRAVDAEFQGKPMPRNTLNRARDPDFTGTPMPQNPWGRHAPSRAPNADFTDTPLSPQTVNRVSFGPIERTSDG